MLDLVVLYCMILFWAVCFSWFPIGVWFVCGFPLCFCFFGFGILLCFDVRLGVCGLCYSFCELVVACLACALVCFGFVSWCCACLGIGLGYCCFDSGFWLIVTFARICVCVGWIADCVVWFCFACGAAVGCFCMG